MRLPGDMHSSGEVTARKMGTFCGDRAAFTGTTQPLRVSYHFAPAIALHGLEIPF